MTIPGLNLPGNLSIDDIVALFRNTRDTGKAVLAALREAVRTNPQLQALLQQFEALFGKPAVELTDAELTDLIGSWHRGLTARSKPFPSDDPPPPPPPTEFPYKIEQNVHPRISNNAKLLRSGDTIYRRRDRGALWIVVKAGDSFVPDPEDWTVDQTMP